MQLVVKDPQALSAHNSSLLWPLHRRYEERPQQELGFFFTSMNVSIDYRQMLESPFTEDLCYPRASFISPLTIFNQLHKLILCDDLLLVQAALLMPLGLLPGRSKVNSFISIKTHNLRNIRGNASGRYQLRYGMRLHRLLIIRSQETHGFIQGNVAQPFPLIFWPKNDGHPPLCIMDYS